jgi:hypothetical protein
MSIKNAFSESLFEDYLIFIEPTYPNPKNRRVGRTSRTHLRPRFSVLGSLTVVRKGPVGAVFGVGCSGPMLNTVTGLISHPTVAAIS